MTRRDETSLVRLFQFAKIRMLPGVQDVERQDIRWLHWYRLGELLEAVWWLILGVEQTYFPRDEAVVLWNRYASIIKTEFNQYQNSGLEFFPPALSYEFSQRLLSGPPFNPSAGADYDVRARARHIFEQGLMLSNSFFRDQTARRCAATLRFLPSDQWNRVSGSNPTVDQVTGVLRGVETESEAINYEAIVAGFSRILEHMAASEEQFLYATEQMDRAFCDRLGQIEAWRLDFRNESFSLRFDRTTMAWSALSGSAGTPELLETVRRLKESWIKNHPVSLHLVATPGSTPP
ncbi:MAG: hypothetical protein LAO55_24160 [Acidobacteriia bacterium]|nr:hypothetical protein [Terriglobia bacterium]